MHVLVSGASGFIGINLCQRLLSDGYKVTGVDNFYCSTKDKLRHLTENKKFSFVEHDITQALPSSLQNTKYNAVCNFACPASPIQYLKDPIYTTKVSFFGTLHMLELATKQNIPMLQASTSEVYGDPLEHPQTEKYWGNVNPNGQRACYDEGKRVAESLCFDFIRSKKARVKIIRIFNTYGPHMASDDGRVVSNFIMQALKREPLTVYGDGTQTRSFCYVDDLVSGIVKFLYLPCPPTSTITPKIHGPINLGNPDEITIKELISYIIPYVKTHTIINKDLPENDPKQRKPNIEHAKKVLGWKPQISLKEGIHKTILWFCDEYNLKINNKEG